MAIGGLTGQGFLPFGGGGTLLIVLQRLLLLFSGHFRGRFDPGLGVLGSDLSIDGWRSFGGLIV